MILLDLLRQLVSKYQPLKIRVSDAWAVITTCSCHFNRPGEIYGLTLEAPLFPPLVLDYVEPNIGLIILS